MAKKTKVDEPEIVTVNLRLIPYYGIESDHPALSGHTAVGQTPAKALTAAKGMLATKWPSHRYIVKTVYSNPEVFERAGLPNDTPTDK